MRRIAVMLIVGAVVAMGAGAEGRFLTYVDSDGNEQRVEIALDSAVSVERPDGTIEAWMDYESGVLQRVVATRPSGSKQVEVKYADGVLSLLRTVRPNQSSEASIVYEEGSIDAILLTRLPRPHKLAKSISHISTFPVCR